MTATVLQAVGIAAIAVGFGLWLPFLGVIVAGVGLVLFGLAMERSK